MKITFLGAAQTVTGSSYLVETGEYSFLIDCGMFQGQDVEERNYEKFHFDPKNIDFVILTHAHMDHCGLLPRLVREGFNGDIYMTPPSAALAELILMDAGKIQEQRERKQHGHKYSESMPRVMTTGLYDSSDSLHAVSLFKTVSFNKVFAINDELSFELLKAGHILGAASVVLRINNKEYVFSGDIGRLDQSVIDSFNENEGGSISPELVVMESLYGGINHPNRTETMDQLFSKIESTLQRDGNVIIPCFALHRTQEVLEMLRYAIENNAISRDVQIFLDSPMAIRATEIYNQNASYFNNRSIAGDTNPDNTERKTNEIPVSNSQRFKIDNLRFIRKHKQSLSLLNRKKSIIIAGSGMVEGGRIMNHIAGGIENGKNSIVFVGFQAEGTLGREIVDGATEITINNTTKKVKAEVVYLRGFSAHADTRALDAWLSRFDTTKLKHVALVHAEPERSEAYKEHVSGKNLGNVFIPKWFEELTLD